MGFRYIAAGSALRDRVIQYGDTEVSSVQIGGGGVYAATGLRLWDDSVALAVYTGPDFHDYFDEWLRQVDIDASGINEKFQHCRLVDLLYNEYGTFNVRDHWEEYHVPHCDKIDAALIAPLLSSDTRGVHILGRMLPDTIAELYRLCKTNDTLFSVELEPLRWAGQSGMKELMQELTANMDMFSLNYYEVTQLFPDVRDYKDAVELMQSFMTPCFLRVGTDGAYMLMDGQVVRTTMITELGNTEPTGCGNTSTAAAFWAMTQGYDTVAMSYFGAVTASYNASFQGLMTDTSPAARARCLKVVEKYIKEHKG